MEQIPSPTTLQLIIDNLPTIINGAVALATVCMAFSTWKMTKMTKKNMDEQFKPYIIVYPQPRSDAPNIIQIIVENIGSAPAYDVKFNIPNNFILGAWGIEKAEKLPPAPQEGLFINGMPYFPAGQKRIFEWGQYAGIEKSLNGKPATIIAHFNNPTGKMQEPTKSILSLEDFYRNSAHTPLELRQVKALEKISENFPALNSLLEKKT